jgi:hypothetical protein
MAEHKVGNTVVLVGTIVEIQGDIALVQVDKSFPSGTTTIAVRLGKLPEGDVPPSDEDRIRDAMTEAQHHPAASSPGNHARGTGRHRRHATTRRPAAWRVLVHYHG